MTRRLRIARFAAIAIAIAAVIDPAITTQRASKPQVALISSPADSMTARNVEHELGHDYSIIRGAFSSAAATILVGTSIPTASTAPVFVVSADRALSIESIESPRTIGVHGTSSVKAIVRARGARGKRIDVTLSSTTPNRGHAIVLDSQYFAVTADDETRTITLDVAPHDTGEQSMRVTAHTGASTITADFVANVTDRKAPVLFYDATPSWGATFVRRAAESDARFDVQSRVDVSRNISSRTGSAPQTLSQAAALDSYDVVIVGTPSALTVSDVQGLEDYMRRRGGAVVLLVDQRTEAPDKRLIANTRWRDVPDMRVTTIHEINDGVRAKDTIMLASEIISPAALPPGARAIAWTSADDPVVLEVPHGAGRLIVNGAADAWRFRDPSRSAFNAFWSGTIAAAAGNTPPALLIQTDGAVYTPHDVAYITVSTRTTAGSPPEAALETARSSIPIRLWPSDRLGVWRGAFRVPGEPGNYHVNISGDVGRASTPVIVAVDASRAAPEAHDLLAAWAVSTGGSIVSSTRIADLPREIRRRVHPPAVRVRWHPMRSAWWIVPFALLLSAEWYWRRRRGLL